MKRSHMILMLASMVILLTFSPPVSAQEFRGMWVDAFHPGFKTPEQTTEMVNKVADANLNAIFVQVRKRGDAYYNSDIALKAKDIAPDYDPLADMITKAHAKGIEVHAWLNLFEVWNTVYGKPPTGHVCAVHPDWLTKVVDGRTDWFEGRMYLDPGHPDVQAHVLSVVTEVVSKYQVDGVHLLEFMYPSPMSGYNDTSLARFKAEKNLKDKPAAHDAAWCTWRGNQLTGFLQRLGASVGQVKRTVKLSTGVRPKLTEARTHFLQDWPSWMQSGLLDFVVSMNYRSDVQQFQDNAAEAATRGFDRHVYLGQGSWELTGSEAAKRIQDGRSLGCPGFVLYSYSYLLGDKSGNGEIMRSIKTDAVPSAVPVPSMAWKASE